MQNSPPGFSSHFQHAVSVLSLPVWRCLEMLEMARLGNVLSCHMWQCVAWDQVTVCCQVDMHVTVMVCLVRLVCTPPTISDHLQLRLPTLQCHSDAHCVSSHNHTTPVAGLNSDQCLISPDFVPMSWATTYLSFSPYAAFAWCIFIADNW